MQFGTEPRSEARYTYPLFISGPGAVRDKQWVHARRVGHAAGPTRVIGKVTRGVDAGRLLCYLAGLMSTLIRTWLLGSVIRPSWSRTVASMAASRRITAADWNALYERAAREARGAAAHVRRWSASDPRRGADAAWAVADVVRIAAP